MFKKLTIITVLGYCLCLNALAGSDTVVSNNLFSITMPYETKNTYNVKKNDNGIYVSEKVSDNAGLIGLAFGLKIYKNPSDYANMDGCRKIGELTDKNGIIYDMVLVRPTDIQLSDGKEIQKNYNRLYEAGNNVEIKGINGSNYVKDKGMKGNEIYSGILKKYKKAFIENWNNEIYINEDMGYEYYNLKKANPDTDLMKEIGYAYYDLNSDGIDELLIGKNINQNSYIFDVYTMVNRKPEIVTSGGTAEKLFICNEAFLCKEYQNSSTYGILTVYHLNTNSSIQNFWLSLKHDSSKNAKMKWAVRDKNPYTWEPISKKEYTKLINRYTKNCKKIDFTPFSEVR